MYISSPFTHLVIKNTLEMWLELFVLLFFFPCSKVDSRLVGRLPCSLGISWENWLHWYGFARRHENLSEHFTGNVWLVSSRGFSNCKCWFVGSFCISEKEMSRGYLQYAWSTLSVVTFSVWPIGIISEVHDEITFSFCTDRNWERVCLQKGGKFWSFRDSHVLRDDHEISQWGKDDEKHASERWTTCYIPECPCLITDCARPIVFVYIVLPCVPDILIGFEHA